MGHHRARNRFPGVDVEIALRAIEATFGELDRGFHTVIVARCPGEGPVSPEWAQAKQAALGVEPDQGAGFIFEEANELGGRYSQEFGCRAGIGSAGGQRIERLGQQKWEVWMLWIDANLAAAATGFPEQAYLGARRFTNPQSKQQLQPEQGCLTIFELASSLVSLG